MSKVKNLMSKEDTNRVNLSSVFPYYQRLSEAANIKFSDVAMKLAANLRHIQNSKAGAGAGAADGDQPTTPQVELART